MKRIILIGLFSVIFTFFLFFISSYTFPYKGFFPYKNIALDYTDSFFAKLANFDGVHYLKIAKGGYDQYEQAFFPLYPLLVRVFGFLIGGNLLFAGVILSNLFFILGLVFFYKVLRKIFGKEVAFWASVFLIFFPTSFYLNIVYTEALFFFLFFAGFYFLKSGKVFFSFIFFYLLGLARVVGVLAAPAILIFDKGRRRSFLAALAPVFGILTYMFYLFKTTGDPLFFFNAQPAFGANRSTNLILLPQVYYRYLKIFLTVPFSFSYFVSFLEVSFFSLIFFSLIFCFFRLLRKQRFSGEEMGILLFSILSLIIPTFTGTFLSMPRFVLLAFYFYIFLAKIFGKKWKFLVLVVFFLFRIILSLFFAQGYFIS